jgi:hypothetical protein
MQNSIKYLRAGIILCSAIVLAACASNHTSTRTIFEVDENVTALTNVLVVAVGKDKYHTLEAENLLGQELKKVGVRSVSAHQHLAQDTVLTKELVLGLTKEHNLDGVIVSRIVDANVNRKKIENRTELVVDRPSTGTLFDMYFYEIYEGETTYQKEYSTTAIISTEVFSVANETKLATLETNVTGVQDMYSKMLSTSEHVVKELKADKLIK